MFESQILLIESGKPLEMIKAHVAEEKRVRAEIRKMAIELGIETTYRCRSTGVLVAVDFEGNIHPEFKKRGGQSGAYPKKNSEWAKRFAAQVGFENQSLLIAREFGIPVVISYTTKTGHGSRMIGAPINPCGFLYGSESGPYAMWAPDVPACVAETLSDEGVDVSEPEKSFKFAIEGTRPISGDEWKLIVLKHKIESKGGAA